MNTVKSIQALNKRELENVVPPSGSWHTDYRDTAYVFIGGLSFDLSEGDIETIFSQFGVPTWVKLARDKETGKSRGFGWLKYEDQRSCDLAVDNIGGATVLGRVLRVDHTRYKKKDGEEEEDEKFTIRFEGAEKKSGHQDDEDSDSEETRKIRRPKTKAEKELDSLIRNHDDDDPMKEYLVNQKREEVAAELEALESSKKGSHRHRHRHDRRRDEERDDREKRKHRDRSRERRRRSDSPDRPRRHRSQDRQRRSASRDRSTERRHRR